MFAIPRPEQYLLLTERRVLRTRRHWAILVRDIALTTESKDWWVSVND